MTSDWQNHTTNIHQVAAIESELTYFLPNPLLRSVISHYTVYRPVTLNQTNLSNELINMVPDASGCIVCFAADNKIKVEYWGPSSKVIKVAARPTDSDLYIIIDFLPCGANRILNMPLSSLHNAIMDLDLVDPKLAELLSHAFEYNLINGQHVNFGGFFTLLDDIFIEKNQNPAQLNLTQYIISTIYRSSGTVPIETLAKQTGYSKRHLGRIVTDKLGMNMKLLSRVIRINTACRMIESGDYASLTQLSYRLGYYDQPHFIHDFTSVCGVTPGIYQQNLSHFYNEKLKLTTIV